MLHEFSECEERPGMSDDSALRRLIVPLLALYWLAMFAGTHWPRGPQLGLGVSDKALHFAAFCGLAFLLSAANSISRAMSLVSYAGIFGIVLVYGAIDEISQIPVGRDCEWLDFRADVIGACVGLTLFCATHTAIRLACGALVARESRLEA